MGAGMMDGLRLDFVRPFEPVEARHVVAEHPGTVTMRTSIGGTRVVDMIAGEQLPRIC